MIAPAPDICLVAPGHLASTPRLVKNATALSNAGYRVHVISGRCFPPAECLDEAIVARGLWPSKRVGFRLGRRGLLNRLRRKLARGLSSRFESNWPLAAVAQHAGHADLAQAAAATGARFFYGHGGIAGLAAAAAAARLVGGTYGFDAEDWHLEETEPAQQDPIDQAAAGHLLRTLLPATQLFTCAAPLIGDAYKSALGLDPVCLLNVFPLAEAPSHPTQRPAPSSENPAILYWFSQTIGPGRGLEAIVDTLVQLQTPAVLHLRGFVSTDYAESLRARAGAKAGRLKFLPPAPAAEMARLAAPAHLGLSLELTVPRNRDLCLSNKIFTYLLAGLPQLLSPTSGQTAFAGDLGSAALTSRPGGLAAFASQVDAFLCDPRKIEAASSAAWQLGHERFCWDVEQQVLVELVTSVLGKPGQ